MRRVKASEWNWARDTADDLSVMQSVTDILAGVRNDKDQALRAYTAKFDYPDAAEDSFHLRVPAAALEQAWHELPSQLQEAMEAAAKRIRTFHEAQEVVDTAYEGPDGEQLGLVWRPLQRVGVYAPGGRAPYPSTVLMDVIPAQVAGVHEIAMVSPPTKETGLPHSIVLAAAYLTGIKEVYRVGGAQAVAGLAYGTQTIPRVDKIVGPGNIFVATAKRLVSGTVGIDSIAGPSEVFIVADKTADPQHIAADMLAQAEHDVEAGAVCVALSAEIAEAVETALSEQLPRLARRQICEASLERWGCIVIADNMQEALAVVNQSAPEHLELLVENPRAWTPEIYTAGAVFLGPHSPEPVGDYYAGTNHVLPTHGSARFASGLGRHDFLRRMSTVEYQAETLAKHRSHIVLLARAEGLQAHAEAVEVRFQNQDKADRNGSEPDEE
nr:histidinol dehydrogenase [Alicyclobacillus sp. SO9]